MVIWPAPGFIPKSDEIWDPCTWWLPRYLLPLGHLGLVLEGIYEAQEGWAYKDTWKSIRKKMKWKEIYLGLKVFEACFLLLDFPWTVWRLRDCMSFNIFALKEMHLLISFSMNFLKLQHTWCGPAHVERVGSSKKGCFRRIGLPEAPG